MEKKLNVKRYKGACVSTLLIIYRRFMYEKKKRKSRRNGLI